MDALTNISLIKIFNEAAEIAEPSARASFLAKACEGHAELRRQLDALLAADSEAGTLGESAAEDSGADLALPITIGRYRLVQKIGEGGWGTVYLAEQQEPIRRRVALKLIKPGMDTRQVIGRFEAERQALALMDHPNIAKVLDAGTSNSGRPYFVMELVSGVKLTDYCDQQRLDPQQRVELFAQVCDAIQHAHHKGIIHRDLKPSNILVADGNGTKTPKIIDFGIAKAVEGRLTDQTLSIAMEQFLGTPAYMSPEQASGGATDVDTRSDIYSLGVILYELLTGHTPFDQRELLRDGLDAMRRTIREKPPLRPSTKLSTLTCSDLTIIAQARKSAPPRLLSLVRGDLEWIVMKCLEKDRSRRYVTANGMATDLRRYLGHEAVLARPPTVAYRIQNWVHRNKTLFVATSAVLLSLTIGLVTTTWAFSRERAARFFAANRAYVSEMLLAGQALEEHNLGRARELLRHHLPKSGEPDLRNWEWRYLADRCAGDDHKVLAGHFGVISNVRFMDENTLFSTGMNDFRAITWNVDERRAASVLVTKKFGGGISNPMALASRRRKLFFRPGWSSTPGIMVVDLETGNQTAQLTELGTIQTLDVSPNEALLAIGRGNRIELLDLDGKSDPSPLATTSAEVRDVRFSHEGNWLVAGDDAGEIGFWSLSELRKMGALINPVRIGPGRRLALSIDDSLLAVGGGIGSSNVSVWNVESRTLVANWNDTAEAGCIAFSPDGKWLITGGGDTTVRLWDTTTWQKSRTLYGHINVVSALDVSPDSRSLVTGTDGGELFRWSLGAAPRDADTGPLPPAEWYEVAHDGSGFVRILRNPMTNGFYRAIGTELWSSSPLEHIGQVKTEDLELSCPPVVLSGGRKLALGGHDGSIRLRGADDKEVIVMKAHASEVVSIDITMKGSLLVSAGHDEVRLWRLPELRPVGKPFFPAGALTVKLSEDSRFLAGFTGSGDVATWNLSSLDRSPLCHTFAPMRNLGAAAFSPDNRCIAAAAGGDMGFIWDRTAKKRTALPHVLMDYISLAYSTDGNRLVVGSLGEAGIFSAATGETMLSLRPRGMKLAFFTDGERLLAVNSEGAKVLRAPPLKSVESARWLTELPTAEPPEYLGPRPAGILFAEPHPQQRR